LSAFTPKKKKPLACNRQLERALSRGLSPKIPQLSYDDTQHMHIGRGRRIGFALDYGYTVKGVFTVMSRTDLLPDAGPVLPLRQAIYRAGRDYKGGITALAFDMVLDNDTLQKKLKLDEERRWLNPDELEEVIRLTGDSRLLDALMRPAGAVWYRPVPVPATRDALKAVGKLLAETGELVAAMHDGAADNVWELHKVVDLEKQGMDVIREVLGIMAGARMAMEDRVNG